MKKEINIKSKIQNYSINCMKIKTERNGLGALKTLIVVFLLFVQLALFVLSYLYIATFVKSYLIISLILTLISCLHVICSKRNSQSKPVWVLFLIITFSFGYIFYFLSDERVLWSKNKKRYEKIRRKATTYKQETSSILHANPHNERTAKYLIQAGNFYAHTNSTTTYYKNGSSFLDSVLNDIKQATDFVFIEFFIISDGIVLSRFLEVLTEKAKRGVDVRIIYDDLGSHRTISRKTKKRITNSGIKLVSFNKLLPRLSLFLNYRDHRKIVVVDGKTAFTGGVNLADEYANEKRVYGYWKDAGLKIVGDAVDSLTLAFLTQWEFLTKTNDDFSRFLDLHSQEDNSSITLPYLDGLEYSNSIGKDVYADMIASATEKIYIMSPYLVLDDTIKDLLVLKAQSGVDVKIIIPQVADKKLVYVQTRNTAEKLMLKGVKVFTMENSFVHSKLLLTENSAVVGSINFDLRSFYQQFENAVFLTDKNTMTDIEKDFDETFKKCIEITPSNMNRRFLSFRILSGITSLLSPFM